METKKFVKGMIEHVDSISISKDVMNEGDIMATVNSTYHDGSLCFTAESLKFLTELLGTEDYEISKADGGVYGTFYIKRGKE